jgi:hypothetical protein
MSFNDKGCLLLRVDAWVSPFTISQSLARSHLTLPITRRRQPLHHSRSTLSGRRAWALLASFNELLQTSSNSNCVITLGYC